MVELWKNIGLGIFINGAYAWQFSSDNELAGRGILQGVFIMALAIYLQARKKGGENGFY